MPQVPSQLSSSQPVGCKRPWYSRYASVRQSLGEPDPFRLRHRAALRTLISEVVRGPMGKQDASAHVAAWAGKNIDALEREKFREVAESELLGLHEGNFARYQIRPSEFDAWRSRWEARAGAHPISR